MKVQCGQCPAKYAVSDDRIQGKKVRIRCKRCGAAILVDGRSDPAIVSSSPAGAELRPSEQPSAPPAPERAPVPSRPPAPTMLGGMEAPLDSEPAPPASVVPTAPAVDESGKPGPDRGFTDPPQGSDPNRWRVALTKQDLRWMTTDQVKEAYESGAIRAETFVFRKEMARWEALAAVAELAAALGIPHDPSSGQDRSEAPTSSRPPARKPPSSRPPPRKPARSEAGVDVALRPRASSAEIAAKGGSASIASSLAESLDGSNETDESMPFSLDAARASSSRPVVTTGPLDGTAQADEALFSAAPTTLGDGSAGTPTTLAPPAVPAGGGRSPWLIVLVVVIVLAAILGVILAAQLGYLPYSP